jgi:hypothetical protein
MAPRGLPERRPKGPRTELVAIDNNLDRSDQHPAMRPAVIVRCSGVADVLEALRFARDHDLPVVRERQLQFGIRMEF